MSALGLIETKGLVAAIEAADAMVKSADVQIIERHQVGGGLVTIIVTGEVSAVNAAVDAAIVAVGRIDGGQLISSHVIPRPYDEVSALIVADKKDSKPSLESTPDNSLAPESLPALAQKDSEAKALEEALEVKEPEEQQEQKSYTLSELQNLPINKLRKLVEEHKGLSLSKQAIKTASKKKLIEAILNVTK
ncbi:MAG: ethanolamine utilization protein EutM [Desulforhopalus sp.]|jgi:ethanolamine utilization protein EutM